MAFRRIQSFIFFPPQGLLRSQRWGTEHWSGDGTFPSGCLAACIALYFEFRGLYIYIWRKAHFITGMGVSI
ncbi:hypothetical protein NA56DRAFT_106857 [Hyaloscypha hepaticicola]|uniref:Uncharacterized protein n=1 Tax=Hyaloscypha hepaticicola TaxID=2082293 RepID=A0A2J6Q6Q3_9HELO|nr:hypothetical protein NA56DRAFT_106857 [Hyaloscypha hepaticicola]